jgi:DNA topoisomerase-1
VQVERSPPAPFTTSTLQQEASAKLNFDSGQTMLLAQRLYEGADVGAGLITYMRTDAVTLSAHAIADIRSLVGARYGPQYLPPQARVYKSKAKNAQEAHEAIRPTAMHTLPSQLAGKIDPAALRLYSLTWRRTAACQMANAVYAQLAVDVDSASQDLRLHAVTSQLAFPGHLAVHSDQEVGARFASEAVPEADEAGSDREAEGGEGGGLQALAVGQPVAVHSVSPDQHFTQPPPRFTEGTLVRNKHEAPQRTSALLDCAVSSGRVLTLPDLGACYLMRDQ